MRLQELINEILDLSKIESGMMEFNYAPVSLYILCEDVKNTYSFRWSTRSGACFRRVRSVTGYLDRQEPLVSGFLQSDR